MSEEAQATETEPEQKQNTTKEIILGDRNPADDMPEDGEPF